jgi:hypothetical protein
MLSPATRSRSYILFFLSTSFFFHLAAQALPVFPGATGYGTETVAGRGGQVYVVNRLADDNQEGSLRYAVTRTGPRIVIFAISGTITLNSQLTIHNPFITIAGQTAPAPGILIRGETFVVNTHDVLIQHLAIRPGDTCDPDPEDGNCEDFDAMTVGAVNKHNTNVVIDHISASWSVDEMFTYWASANTAPASIHNATVSNSIFAEPLNATDLHPEGRHPFGLLSGDGAERISIVNNVMSIIEDRNPLVRADTTDVLIANNFVHRPGGAPHGRIYYGSAGSSNVPMRTAAIGNVAVVRPNSSLFHVFIHSAAPTSFQLYMDNNLLYNPSGGSDGPALPLSGNQWDPTNVALNGRAEANVRVNRAPLCYPGFAPMTETAQKNLEEYLLATAGARPANRDPVDQRIINNIRARTGSPVVRPADVGGYPPLAVNQVTHVLPTDPNGDADSDGYTNIEEWLHAKAQEVEGQPPLGTLNRNIAVFDSFDNSHSSRWTSVASGAWSVVPPTGVGAKVFKQSDTLNAGTPARANPAVLRNKNWTNQVVQTRMRAISFDGTDRWLGVAGRYRDWANYYYIALRSSNVAQLRKLSNGSIVPLDEAPFSVGLNTWYTVRLEMNGSTLRGYINDLQTPILEATDTTHASGRPALVMHRTHAEYDDVVATPTINEVPYATDDFEDNNTTGWSMDIPWTVADVECNKVFAQTVTSGDARAQFGDVQTDMAVQARVRARAFNGTNRFAALYARYQGIGNSYYMTLRNNNKIELKKVVNNVIGTPALDEADFAVPLDTWFTMRLEVQGNALRGYVNGELLLEATDTSLASGRGALGTFATSAEFDDVILSRLRP